MAAKGASARRYAQAAFSIALERGELDRWLDDLALLADAMENAEFAGFMDAPQISAAQKTSLARETLGGSVSELALNLMALLASRSSARLITDITEAYQRMLDKHNGVERAEILSAVPLTDEQRARIVDMLRGVVGKEVTATASVEPRILGGFVARVGDKVIDGSTRARLEGLRRELAQGT